MKILSLVSSYRKNGNTARVAELIIKQIHRLNIDDNIIAVENINIGHMDINMCHGCRMCFDKGEDYCSLKDDLLIVRDKMLDADIIILSSPVYEEDVNGIMKNWIDRLAFNSHRPNFAGKKAYVITTSGNYSSNHSLRTMKLSISSWGFKVIGQKKFIMGALMDIHEINNKYGKDINNIAHNILKSNKTQKNKPTLYSLIVFKVQQKHWQKNIQKHDTFDYKYWFDKGWLKTKCNYYIPHRSNLIKVKLARSLGSLIALIYH